MDEVLMPSFLDKVKLALQKNASTSRKKNQFIAYKIVDFKSETAEYVLQQLNSRIVFLATITEIVFDKELLSFLYPEQACYIGLEYAKFLESHKPTLIKKLKPKSEEFLTCRYGKFKICYQDRIQNICFINIKTNEEFLMDPRDIALSEQLISKFDSMQAFYIGFSAGLKLRNPTKNTDKNRKPFLTIIK